MTGSRRDGGEEGSKSERTRRRILTAAAEIFAQSGYYHTRMQDIAKRAGTHSGAIYYYFPSRVALVQEILAGSINRVWQAVEQAVVALPADASPSDRIRAAIIAHVVFVLGDDMFVKAYLRIENQVAPEDRASYVENPRGFSKLWKDLLAAAVAAGELRGDLDLRVARQSLLGSMVWTSQWYRPGKATPAQIGASIADLFLDGARPR